MESEVKNFRGRRPAPQLDAAQGGFRTIRVSEDVYWRVRNLAADTGRSISGTVAHLARAARSEAA